MSITPSIRSLAVAMPPTVRTNDWFRERHPELLVAAEERALARMFHAGREAVGAFDRAMVPYQNDPFRGAVARRVFAEGETSVAFEADAARRCLAQCDVNVRDIDLLVSVSFRPEHHGVGNAVFVARELGLRGAAWNLETACAGPLTALQTACAQVRAGEFERVLVTASCGYARYADPSDTTSWFMGDGAGAFLVERSRDQGAYLAAELVHSASTCDTWYFELQVRDGAARVVMGATERTGPAMRESAEPYLRRCTEGALRKAGLHLDDVDFFVFHTPTAWFADFAATALGVARERTVSTFPHYANCGPALTCANLHYAAATGRIRPGDIVLLYAPGSVSSCACVVMRWGEVALGPLPPDVAA